MTCPSGYKRRFQGGGAQDRPLSSGSTSRSRLVTIVTAESEGVSDRDRRDVPGSKSPKLRFDRSAAYGSGRGVDTPPLKGCCRAPDGR